MSILERPEPITAALRDTIAARALTVDDQPVVVHLDDADWAAGQVILEALTPQPEHLTMTGASRATLPVQVWSVAASRSMARALGSHVRETLTGTNRGRRLYPVTVEGAMVDLIRSQEDGHLQDGPGLYAWVETYDVRFQGV
ncbi:hypothetical protein [Cellulomonas sp. C5510]|uniref:hypothetical protein n=1 Tax=Cellulomonas sp. C5510 TaxID=2871170 RepID=UPI001C93CECD|nr:hypothetical protein [Cellulomonas sp. C5510]QZN86881.1 hypothetical protein K5O09_07160 [Cellulomonas sp. C5510]